MENGDVCDAEVLKGQPVIAFCGIAKPEGFRQILQDGQVQLKMFKSFPDHHEYSLNDVKELESIASQEGVKYILVSEKDAVKLKSMKFSLPFFKVVIDLEILEGREIFNNKNVPSRLEVMEKLIPYIHEQTAKGTQLNHIMRHTVGLFHGQNGSRTWKQYLSKNMCIRDADLQKVNHIMDQVKKTNPASLER